MTNPEPETPALDDLPDGDELHKEEYIGEEVLPNEDPNLQEHYDG
jgi:hypothetical protein